MKTENGGNRKRRRGYPNNFLPQTPCISSSFFHFILPPHPSLLFPWLTGLALGLSEALGIINPVIDNIPRVVRGHEFLLPPSSRPARSLTRLTAGQIPEQNVSIKA